MKLHFPSSLPLAGALLALSTSCGHAQPQPAPAPVKAPASPGAALFAPTLSDKDFQIALQAAEKAGVPLQQRYEAQFLHAIRSGDLQNLGDLAPVADEVAATFEPSKSRLFKTREQFESLRHGLKGLNAGLKADDATFETETKEAFWQWPGSAQIVGGWIEEIRREQKMRALTFPLDTKFGTSDGKIVTLRQVMTGKKAALLDFWASWCGPCMANIPELKARGFRYIPKGLAVVGINTEGDPKIAAKVKADKQIKLVWLVEPADEPLSRLLDISSIPRAVVVSPDGKVLYNGHPASPRLERLLDSLAEKPATPEVGG